MTTSNEDYDDPLLRVMGEVRTLLEEEREERAKEVETTRKEIVRAFNWRALLSGFIAIVAIIGAVLSLATTIALRNSSHEARLVLCHVANRNTMQAATDLITVAEAQYNLAVAQGHREPRTEGEQADYEFGKSRFLKAAEARTIPCEDFADNPDKYVKRTNGEAK